MGFYKNNPLNALPVFPDFFSEMEFPHFQPNSQDMIIHLYSAL